MSQLVRRLRGASSVRLAVAGERERAAAIATDVELRERLATDRVADDAGRTEPRHDYTIVARRRLRFVEDTRVRLLASGLHEAVSYSFMSDADVELLGLEPSDPRRAALRVANPLSQDQALMRTSLIPAMARALGANVAQRAVDVGLFEIARRFDATGDANTTLALLVTGARARHFSGDRTWDLHDVKGLAESLVGPHAVRSRWARPQAPEPYLHPGVQATWSIDDRPLGVIGQLHPAVLAKLDVELEAPVFVAELDFDALAAVEKRTEPFHSFPRYPAVTRDFALLHDRDADYGLIDTAVAELAATNAGFAALFESLELFDLYQGEQVPEGKRSLAIQVVYRASDRTLTDEEVARADEALLGHLRAAAGASLRS